MNDHTYRSLHKLYTERNTSEAALMAFMRKLVALKVSEPELKDEIERRVKK